MYHARPVIQVLVILLLLSIGLGLLLQGVQRVREAANLTRCSNNMRQVVLATHNLHSTYNFVFSNPDTHADTTATLQFFLLPYME